MAKCILVKVFRFFGLLIFGAIVMSLGIDLLGWSERLTSSSSLPIVLTILCLVILFTFAPRRTVPAKHWPMWVWGIVFFVSLPFALMLYLMGVNDLGIILVFLQGNTMAGALDLGALSFLEAALKKSVGMLIFFGLTVFFYYRIRLFTPVILLFSIVAIVIHPVTTYFYRIEFPNPIAKEIAANSDQYSLNILAPPATKKNLIIIYAEGYERNLLHMPETQLLAEPISRLVKKGTEFTNVALTYGAHYSTAGVVATQCGVPLLPIGIFSAHSAKAELLIPVYDQIKCLPDILSQVGYDVSFFVGTVLKDYSLENFLLGHSYSQLFGSGLETDIERQENPLTPWGLPDSLVFGRARAKLQDLAKSDDPFMLVVETMATHGPDGYPDQNCGFESETETNMAAALKCTADHINSFVELVSELNLDENTIVAVMSDHLIWENVFTPMLEASKPRRNLFFLLNAGEVTKIDKLSSALDIYPTLLESLGYTLEGRRANLGISLFSEVPTLAQQYDVEGLSSGLEGNKELSRWLWRLE